MLRVRKSSCRGGLLRMGLREAQFDEQSKDDSDGCLGVFAMYNSVAQTP